VAGACLVTASVPEDLAESQRLIFYALQVEGFAHKELA